MFCSQCGNSISSLDSVCTKCGHPLRTAQASERRGWLISPKLWTATAWATGITWILNGVLFFLGLPNLFRGDSDAPAWGMVKGTLINLCINCGLLWLLVTRRWRYSLNERGRYLGWTIGQAALLVYHVGVGLLGLQMFPQVAHTDAFALFMLMLLFDFVATFLLAINTIAIPARNLSEGEVAHKV